MGSRAPADVSPAGGTNRRGQDTALTIFGSLAETYDRVLDYGTLLQDRRWKSWVLKAAQLKAGSRVLDIGCGTCVLEESLAPYRCWTVGVDLTEEMVRLGQDKRTGVEGLFVGDAEHLPFPDEAFDAVVSCYVAKYCQAPTFVSETFRVLRPGGRAVLYDFGRPNGLLSPFVAFYTYGVLRLIGAVLDAVGSRAAYTFANLPDIIMRSRWDEEIEGLLRSRASTCERKALCGGAAIGFSAVKRA